MSADSHAPSSATSILQEWAKKQPKWVQSIVAGVVAGRTALEADAVETIYQALLAEEALSPDEPESGVETDASGTETSAVSSSREGALLLRCLSDVENVNALVAGQSIVFNDNLTLLYGENGAGKSGYIRVLSRAAGARSVEEILANVHAGPATAQPSAKIEVRVGGVDETLLWKNEAGLKPLDCMSLFDARYSNLHVDESLEYTYTPRDLAPFALARDAISSVKARLQSAADARRNRCETSPLRARDAFAAGTVVATHLNALSHTTDPRELSELAVLLAEERTELGELPAVIERLDPKTARKSLELARRDDVIYRTLRSIAVAAREFDWEALRSAFLEREEARAAYVEQSSKEINVDDMFGGPSDEWEAFIRAGELLLQKLKMDSYPEPKDGCSYCRQALADEARSRIRRYRRYVNNPEARAFEAAKQRHDELVCKLQAYDTKGASGAVRERLKAAPEGAPDRPLLRNSLRMLGELEQARNRAERGEEARGEEVVSLATAVEPAEGG